jgi:phospholipid/cholesterol/gamma-HCH transport system substrate-binding protein
MKKYFTKEVSIAIITIISGFVLYAGLNYMKGTNVFKHTNFYYVKMNNVSELQKSSPVYADGFKVGLVRSIDFGYENHSTITVCINLDKEMRVPLGSYFDLKSGLTSGAYLNLMLNRETSVFAQPGDTLEGRTEIGMMDKISRSVVPTLEQIMPRLDSILIGLHALVTHPALSNSMEQLSVATTELAASSRQLNSLLANDIKPLVGNLNTVSGNLAAFTGNLNQLDLSATMKSVDEAVDNLNTLSRRLNQPDSSLGLLLNDRSLYDNLDSTAVNASRLLLDLRQNPKRYVHFSLF